MSVNRFFRVSPDLTERRLSGPARAHDGREPARERGFTHIEPDRKNGSVGLDRDQDAAVEAGAAGVEPLQPVDGREAGLGVVEGEKLPVHGAPGRS